MQLCPIRLMAHKYDRLAKQWLENEDDDTFDELWMVIASVEKLTPGSITGAAFLIGCAVAELDVVVREGDVPHIRLAAERRVMKLLSKALIFLESLSDELPSAWKLVVPAGDEHLEREYLSPV